MADESCTGCNVTGDCWWLDRGGLRYFSATGCPCQDCLIKIMCEELCENAFHIHPLFRGKDLKTYE